jgi:hypothetical protein
MIKIPKLVFLGALAGSIALGATAFAQGSNVQGWNTGHQSQSAPVSSDAQNGDPLNLGQLFQNWENFFRHFHLSVPAIHHHHHHVGPPGGSVNPGGDNDNDNDQGNNNNDQ